MEKSITVVVTQQPTTNFVKYQYFIEATNLSIKVPPIKLVKLAPVFCFVFQVGLVVTDEVLFIGKSKFYEAVFLELHLDGILVYILMELDLYCRCPTKTEICVCC